MPARNYLGVGFPQFGRLLRVALEVYAFKRGDVAQAKYFTGHFPYHYPVIKRKFLGNHG